MLLNTEERLAYWGHKHMNVSCRDINDEEEPDMIGLERILYGVGFLAITSLAGIRAFDDEAPAYLELAAVNEDEDGQYYWSAAEDEQPGYTGADDGLPEPKTYPIEHEAEQIVLEETDNEESSEIEETVESEEPEIEIKEQDEQPPVLVFEYIVLHTAA